MERCSVCGKDDGLHVLLDGVPDEETGTGTYRIVVCGHCGHGNTDPVPDDETIRDLYSGENHDYEMPGTGALDRLKDALAQRFVRRITAPLAPPIASVLDYGTGGGRYAAAASRALPGATVSGVDFAAAPPPGSYYDVERELRYLRYGELAGERFDLVLLRHVLEHVREPVAFLRGVLELTTDKGAVYVEVPNLHSRTAGLAGVRWPLYFVPRHVSHFSSASLAYAIARAGGAGRVGHAEMPLMSNVLGLRLGSGRYDARFKIPGILLHPVQLALEASARESTCLWALVTRIGERQRPIAAGAASAAR